MILEHLNINYCKYVKMLYLKYIFKKNKYIFFKINYMEEEEEELKAIVLRSIKKSKTLKIVKYLFK